MYYIKILFNFFHTKIKFIYNFFIFYFSNNPKIKNPIILDSEDEAYGQWIDFD